MAGLGFSNETDDDHERYKEGRQKLQVADTADAVNRDYPKTQMDLEGQVDMQLDEEKKDKTKRTALGALETSSNSMRDYRVAVEK